MTSPRLATRVFAGIAFALFLSFPSNAQPAKTAAAKAARAKPKQPITHSQWGDLKPGPYGVGFRLTENHDYARTRQPKRDAEGKLVPGNIYRPFQIYIWYPAAPAGGAQMTEADYQALPARAFNFSMPKAEVDKRVFDGMKANLGYYLPEGASDERIRAMLATRVAARRNAPQAAGKFPLVVFADEGDRHSVMVEYLASHGYVVVSYPYLGTGPQASSTDNIEGGAEDIGFAHRFARALKNVDPDKMALLGDSSATEVLYAMRNGNVDAVIGMEGQYYPAFRAAHGYDVLNMRVPLLHIQTEERNAFANPQFFNTAVYSDRTVMTLVKVRHGEQYAQAMAWGIATPRAKSAFEMITECVRKFLDAHVKQDAAALEWVRRTPEANGYPADLTRMWSRAAVPAPPTRRDFMALLNQTGGPARAAQVFAEARRVNPEVTLFDEVDLNQLGYRFLQGKQVKDAIEVFKINAAAYPRSANTWDGLAEAYEADGNTALAIENFERALAMIPRDTTSNPATLQAVQFQANQKLRALRPQPGGPTAESPIVYRVPGMDKAVVHRDLVYKSDGAAQLKADVYVPPGLAAGERRPAAIFIHGGPVGPDNAPKDWGVYTSYGRLMAASGIVGVTFNHRYHGLPQMAAAAADVTAAVQFIRANAARFNVDPERIAILAYSGGGRFLAEFMRERQPWLRALVSVYANLDIRGSRPQNVSAQDVPDELLARLSPIVYLAEGSNRLPPILIARAGLDGPLLNNSVDRFVREAIVNSVQVDVLSHPTGRHGFDVSDDNDRSREVIAAIVEFIKRELSK